MSRSTKNEMLYVATAFSTSVCGLTWMQTLYNDPSFSDGWNARKWVTIIFCSMWFVMAQTFIAWKAYNSDPNVENFSNKQKEKGSTE